MSPATVETASPIAKSPPVASHTLIDVGTQSRLSGTRLSQHLAGIDTPTLHGLHAARNYLHHGQAETLDAVFTYAGGSMLTADDAEFISEIDPNAAGTVNDNPLEGGGGFFRGAFTGQAINLVNDPGASTPTGVRFNNVDGGTGGGLARIAIRYVKRYGNDTAEVTVNGNTQTITLLQQSPDNAWQTSGWRWLTLDATLNAGTTNTIEIFRTGNDFTINTVLVANADDLARAQPHRLVSALPTADQDDLIQYLLELDGRTAAGVALADPAPAPAEAPSIIVAPQGALLSAGNTLHLNIAVSGTGPFTYQWYQAATPTGNDSPQLEILNLTTDDSGAYHVIVTNTQGSISSTPVPITVNPAISITTESLALATEASPYTAQLTYAGGIATPTWTLYDGSLPAGLSLSADGLISGIPTIPARAELTVRVADTSGSATQTLALDVQPVGGFINDPDLILYYSFDERQGTQVWDTSLTGNNHSTYVADAEWIADGRFGGAYGPADSSARIADFYPANQADLDFDPRGEAYTISLWVRSTATNGYNTIIGKDRDGEPYDAQYRIWMTNTGSLIQAVNGNQYSSTLDVSTDPLTDGQWHLLTLVNQLETDTWMTRLYYDDGSQFVSFATGSGGQIPGLLNIGDTTRGGNSWNGQIDDLRIYQRALTQAEVAALYIPANATDFNTWILNHAPRPDSQSRAHADDPDGDLSSNLEEYIFGSDPTDSNDASQPRLIGPSASLRYHVTLNPDTAGWQVIVETSESLNSWEPLATSADGAPFTGEGTMEVISTDPHTTAIGPITVPDSARKRFYRTRIEQQP